MPRLHLHLPPALVAGVGGAGIWWATTALSGRREAWDAPVYWFIAYPLTMALAGVLGYRYPVRAWRWGVAVMLGQTAALVVSTRSLGLLPLGLILFGILALPPAAVATAAARWRPGPPDA